MFAKNRFGVFFIAVCVCTLLGDLAFGKTSMANGSGVLGKIRNLTKEMNAPRVGHACGTLANGDILIAGGAYTNMGATTEVEVFSPGRNSFELLAAGLSVPRSGLTMTVLNDGRVLLAGGAADYDLALDNVEIVDPSKVKIDVTEKMTSPRVGHSATLLPNGKVLIVGGNDGQFMLSTAELFDPTTNSFTLLPARLNTARSGHKAVLVNNRFVLIIGGESGDNIDNPDLEWKPLASAEVYDLRDETFSYTKNTMQSPREYHQATLLDDGKVLVTGGISDIAKSLNTADMFDPTTMTFEPIITRMNSERSLHTATKVDNDKVILCGGVERGSELSSCEFFDVSKREFQPAPSLTLARWGHEAVALQNGDVLFTGGLAMWPAGDRRAGGPTASAEIYISSR